MNLKRRLFLTNFATVAIPLVITFLLAFGYLFLFGRFADTDISLEKYRQLAQIEWELLNHPQSVLREQPGLLEEESFRKELSDKLAGIKGEFVMLKNDEVLFSSRDFSKIDLAKLDAVNNPGDNEQVVIDNISYISRYIHVQHQGNSGITLILLAPVGGSTNNLMNFFIFIGSIFLFAFIITNIFVTHQLSKRILEPIYNLQLAAGEISKGNLGHQISEEGDREIQELCRDLELMRIKLKDLIHTQLKYEDNRRMLVSSISHDLKTPVTSIKGYVEGILDGVANTPEKIEKYLQTIYLKTEQVDKMIDDLLLFSKLDLNQIPFNLEKTDIDAYLASCLKESELELEKSKMTLCYRNELCEKRFILLDQEKIKRVIMNILHNSCKYRDKEQGEIQVVVRETKTSVIIEFKDNGPGIEEKDLPYVFDRFYRSDLARTDIKGSGLGLAIAKQIIEGHNGRIWALSPREEGTAILISFSK